MLPARGGLGGVAQAALADSERSRAAQQLSCGVGLAPRILHGLAHLLQGANCRCLHTCHRGGHGGFAPTLVCQQQTPQPTHGGQHHSANSSARLFSLGRIICSLCAFGSHPRLENKQNNTPCRHPQTAGHNIQHRCGTTNPLHAYAPPPLQGQRQSTADQHAQMIAART